MRVYMFAPMILCVVKREVHLAWDTMKERSIQVAHAHFAEQRLLAMHGEVVSCTVFRPQGDALLRAGQTWERDIPCPASPGYPTIFLHAAVVLVHAGNKSARNE